MLLAQPDRAVSTERRNGRATPTSLVSTTFEGPGKPRRGNVARSAIQIHRMCSNRLGLSWSKRFLFARSHSRIARNSRGPLSRCGASTAPPSHVRETLTTRPSARRFSFYVCMGHRSRSDARQFLSTGFELNYRHDPYKSSPSQAGTGRVAALFAALHRRVMPIGEGGAQGTDRNS